jgi:peroxiredoxin
MPKVALNAVAPDFSLVDFEDREFRLSDQHGKANVVLIFNRGFT